MWVFVVNILLIALVVSIAPFRWQHSIPSTLFTHFTYSQFNHILVSIHSNIFPTTSESTHVFPWHLTLFSFFFFGWSLSSLKFVHVSALLAVHHRLVIYNISALITVNHWKIVRLDFNEFSPLSKENHKWVEILNSQRFTLITGGNDCYWELCLLKNSFLETSHHIVV